MNADTRRTVEQLFSEHTSMLFSELESFLAERSLAGKLDHGCWSNEAGNVVGWVGYLPHGDPSEESIELVLTLTSEKNGDTAKFDAGIYWSDGPALRRIVELDNIDFADESSHIRTVIAQQKAELLSEMKGQISIDRPPRIRQD